MAFPPWAGAWGKMYLVSSDCFSRTLRPGDMITVPGVGHLVVRHVGSFEARSKSTGPFVPVYICCRGLDIDTCEPSTDEQWYELRARDLEAAAVIDEINRREFCNTRIVNGRTVAIKAGAGSGKTSQALAYAKAHPSDKILLITFNKKPVENGVRLAEAAGLQNIHFKTIDSLFFAAATRRFGSHSSFLTSVSKKKAFLKQALHISREAEAESVLAELEAFCVGVAPVPREEDWSLRAAWELITTRQYACYETNRKLVQATGALGSVLTDYDTLIVDEAQDVSRVFLSALTSAQFNAGVCFIGDPRQAIYEWRGCVDVFQDRLQFHQFFHLFVTYRTGNSILGAVRLLCDGEDGDECGILTVGRGPDFGADSVRWNSDVPHAGAVYVARFWRNIFKAAATVPGARLRDDKKLQSQIYKVEKCMKFARNSFKPRPKPSLAADDDEEDEDNWMLSASVERLKEYRDQLGRVQKQTRLNVPDATEFATVHGFKGEEANVVYVDGDVFGLKGDGDRCIKYTALTRARRTLLLPLDMPTGSVNVKKRRSSA